ncbi:unnamed protein product, partial [Nesidiocoris tenuis]
MGKMTPATGYLLLQFDRHAARHSRVHGPRPTSQRRDGLRATLIAFGKVFQLGPPANDAPEDGRMAEGARAIIPFERNVPKWLKGEFFSVGPGIFDIGDFTMNHWCDGFGIICKFSLSENE